MFSWQKKAAERPLENDVIAHQPPGVVFPWAKGVVLTALDDALVLAIPAALFDDSRPIGEFVFGPDAMQLNMTPDGDAFFLKLQPGMSVSLAKSCDACIVAQDTRPRRVKITNIAAGA